MPNPKRIKKRAYAEFAVSVCVIALMVTALCLFPDIKANISLPAQTVGTSSNSISQTISRTVSEIESRSSIEDNKSKSDGTKTGESTTASGKYTSNSEKNIGYTKAESKETEISNILTRFEKRTADQKKTSTNKSEPSEPIDNFKKHMMSGLTSNQKAVLYQILNGIENFDTEISIKDNVLKRDDTETLFSLFVLVKIACIENSSVASTYTYIGNKEYITGFKITYTKSKEQALSEKNKLNKKANSVLKGITAEMNEFEKVKYIHDKIIKSCVYGESESGSHESAYGCLVEGRANCEGYSKAFLLLCNKAGIDCMIVTGTAVDNNGESASHMWNMVMVDGKWYHIDLTWDDPMLADNDKSYLEYSYFNITDSEISQTHKSEKNKFYKYPKANSDEDNYFVYYDLCAVDFDSAYRSLERAITQAVSDGNKYASIKLNNKKTFASVKKKLFEASNGGTPVFKLLKSVKNKTGASFSASKASKIFIEQMNIITIGLK